MVTDHNPLTFFSVQPTLSRRQARWSEFLSQFHFTVKYRPGSTNLADSLSRLPEPLAYEVTMILALTLSEYTSDLLDKLKTATASDPHLTDEKVTRKYQHEAGYWTYQGRIVVPLSMRDEIIREHHTTSIAGHFSWKRTADLISRQFWWPDLRTTVQNYVQICDSCQRSKAVNHRPFGLLTPLNIPDSRWHSCTVVSCTRLPIPRTPEGADL